MMMRPSYQVRRPPERTSQSRPWLTRKAAHNAIAEYIETFHNRIRRHSTIGNVSPAAYEEAAMVTKAKAA